MNIDITSTILRCQRKGYTLKDIVIDVILNEDPTIEVVDSEKYNSIDMGFRTLKVMKYFKN
jgi:hypothetical protein